MRQTSFLPDVAPPTTRELIDKLARSNATPEQEPCGFGLFGERQLNIYRLLSKLVKVSGTKPGGDLMPLFMGVCCLGEPKAMMLLTGGE
jgi:hypothetical protein